MKSLVIAEKPSVARDIARVLHCTQKGNGILEGKEYVVTWALGHLVTLADPEEYDKKYMKWDMETLPMMPDKMKLVVIRQTSKQYQAVKTQLFRKDIGDIIIATDAGREGELVARWILDKSGCHKPIRRLWISSVTDKAIRDGFHNLKDGRDYDNLYRAAVARAEADWEKKLSDISKGKLKQKVFLDGIREYTEEIVGEIKTGTGTFRHDNLTNKICPNCGKRMLAVNGKNSKLLVCQDRECGYRETISRTTNARCPKCHKRMEMLVKGKEETFVCVCGYKEKLSSFQARRTKEGAGVNKRDVQKYLKKQQKEAAEPVNNAFAQALSGIKLD